MGYEPATVERDALTNLLSRSHFLLAAGHLMPNASSSSILFVNLDRFRMINDNFTYASGDIVLREASLRILQHIPQNAVASRLSGDEFAIACFNFSVEEAYTLAERIRNAFTDPFRIGTSDVVVTTSIGVATDLSKRHTCAELLQQADTASRYAKDLGRNQVCADPTLSNDALSPLMVETLLRGALRNDDLEIYYQPKVQAKSMQVVGAEALCRWRHPEYGEIPPHSFIPIAESSDLILPIDEYVLRAVCLQGSLWLKDGYRVRMSVNVSSRQFQHPSFTKLVKDVLRETEMDPTLLELEITERTAMNDVDHAVHVLNELRQIGVRIAIDDFGVGYSSLNYLMRFPVHTLKIDRSFTAGIQSAFNQSPVIGAIISLAKSLNLNVVAEGVETVQQFDFLRDNKCDEIQGYLFGEPVPPSSFRLTSFASTPQHRGTNTLGQDQSTLALQLTEYEWLERIGMAALRRPHLSELISTLPDFILERIPFDRFSIELASPDDTHCMIHEAALRDDIPARTVGTLTPVAHSGLSFVRKTKLPSMCGDILRNPEFTEDYALSAQGIRAIVRVPLTRGHDIYGMFTLQSSHKDLYSDNDRRLLQRLASRLSDTIYAAYRDDYLWRHTHIDSDTHAYTRGFLMSLLASEFPTEYLTNALQRPVTALHDVAVLYIAVNEFGHMSLEDAEHSMRYLGQFANTHLPEGAVSIRMGANDLLILLFNDTKLPAAHFVQQLTEHLRMLHTRAERLGDAGQNFDVRLGQATGIWHDFPEVYRNAVAQALQLETLTHRSTHTTTYL